jgi:cell division protein FtsI (penicillin-binding protein 3)
MAYGYGLSMSLLQLATAYTAIAGDGRLRPAYLLKNSKPPESVRVFSEEVAEELRNMIWLSGGAGRKNARANTEGYSVGGKSGTTRKLIDGVYQRGSYRSWFVGMSPISDSYSKIIVAVVIDEPRAGKYYGSAVAAPIFNSVISESLRLMGYQPDTIIERGKQNSD